ncbi:hypothetical protein J7L70_06525 [Candidatus Bathyarchaeota archaeon]|nr:hypothetical protein [Candidatus Bathyarchaeota archaeon]
MTYILSVDVGTTNVKAVVFDLEGRQVFKSSLRCPVYTPVEGWAEQDPDEVLNRSLKVVRDCVKAVDGRVEALTFSAQLYSVMLVDRSGSPLTRILNWMDGRSVQEASEVSEEMDGYGLYRKTGCHISPMMPVAKLLWLKRHRPERFGKVFKVLAMKDYILYRLLGLYVTDRIIASASSLFNIHENRWDPEIAEFLGLSLGVFPTVVEPDKVVGEVDGSLSEKTGLPKGIPVVCGGGDGMLQNIGFGILEPGLAASNIGTSGAVRVTSNRIILDKSRRARFFCHALIGDLWCIGGAINSAGLSLEWFVDRFLDGDFGRFEAEASKAEPGSRGLIFLPYLLGERAPLWCPEAKAVFYGLTLNHGIPELSRAVLEGVILALNHIKRVLEAYVPSVKEVRTGGGGARIALLNQVQADVFQVPVYLTATEEGSALGAAILAAEALGYYRGLKDACKTMVKPVKVFRPNLENVRKYRRVFERYLRLSDALLRLFFRPRPP